MHVISHKHQYSDINTRGTGSLPGVKQLGRGADHPTPSKC